MLFLFLDLEYTGFDLTKDQILEIGAAVCTLENNHLKILNTFETLIKPTIEIPDHIPRLTGLQESDFEQAPDLHHSLKLWQDWIEKNQLHENEVMVIGHSILNDINFLKTNHFWLPQKQVEHQTKIPSLDTLSIAKILLPDQTNLNLEYLVKNLKLDQQVLQDISIFNSDTNFTNLKPHRALFDTLTGIELFNFILKRINTLNLSAAILDYFSEAEILPIKIPSLAANISKFEISNLETLESESINLTFSGKPIEIGLNTKIDLCANYANELIDLIANSELPEAIRRAASQIYIYLATKQALPESVTKIHNYGLEEKVSQEIATDFILYFSKQAIGSTPQTSSLVSADENSKESDSITHIQKIIPTFERILSNIDEITEDEFAFAKFSYLVDYFAQSYNIEFGERFEPKVSIEMDFLAARIEQILQGEPKKEIHVGRLGFNSDLDLNDIFNQFQKICDKFKILNQKITDIPKNDSFLYFLGFKIQTELEVFFAQKWENTAFIVRLSKNVLKFTKPVPNFQWSSYWYKLSQIEDLQLTTYLDQNGWQLLGSMMQMPDDLFHLPNDFVRSLRNSSIEVTQNNQETSELLQETQASIPENSISLVMCGQNSGLDKVVQLAIQNFEPDQFLAVGETGSLAKIVGKIRIGFRGLVILKAMDLFMIKQIQNLNLSSKVLIIQPPHINLNQFWFKNTHDPKETIRTSKRISLNSTIGQLSLLGVEQVIYQPEIVNVSPI
jgi:DNA polymerase III epsilon subunit-like protein